jgi:hypothetical protein
MRIIKLFESITKMTDIDAVIEKVILFNWRHLEIHDPSAPSPRDLPNPVVQFLLACISFQIGLGIRFEYLGEISGEAIMNAHDPFSSRYR